MYSSNRLGMFSAIVVLSLYASMIFAVSSSTSVSLYVIPSPRVIRSGFQMQSSLLKTVSSGLILLAKLYPAPVYKKLFTAAQWQTVRVPFELQA
ncbi:hypothetical protein BKA58DRAFT_383768 [Alternaria rosae]|uniref:uncharacterized protein n=1 Tax=Alternaria rosae TaxID=1187941 RepID=UPI001E8E5D8B|nr:uncharacterized protein BKA58DRAFT_383768 [Alternaria rosae]KAH6873258.1 hypothetical protein BKA58DRAFT_383768 [Alternaria rosae]